ncbi:hypothetical protein [Rhizobium sp. S96]|uniref:hypothetical protein n=1 Tax=Rhizobium sp. S96 TaxID=3055140 RepID=UPI0025AB5B9D|nr:hypothetical protein [Rhizobium sp. S96]MDM9622705.1 hypothetical protein [Rhizobium sp. S96]
MATLTVENFDADLYKLAKAFGVLDQKLSIERLGGCDGAKSGALPELEAQCRAYWARQNEPSNAAWNNYTNRKGPASYPACFAELCAESMEVRLLVARRLTELSEAGIDTDPRDHLSIEIGESSRRRGFLLTARFSDGLSAKRYADFDERELEVPLSAEISLAYMRPAAAVKNWKARKQAEEQRYLPPKEGQEVWRLVPEEREPPSPQSLAENRRWNIKAIRIVEERRKKSGLDGLDRRDAAHLTQLLEEEEEYIVDRLLRTLRLQELYEDFHKRINQEKAVKELGMALPPNPEGWDAMLRECDETAEMTANMARKFARLGRTDTPVPYSFFWDGILNNWYMGGLFGIVFNGDDGPKETRLLHAFTTPIRAALAPEKALAEWQKIKALRERQALTPREIYDLLSGDRRWPKL